MARQAGGPFSLMATWQIIFGGILAAGFAVLLVRRTQFAAARRANRPFELFGEAATVLDEPAIGHGEAVGTYTLTGRYNGHTVQVKAITDTLAIRKLPSLWLMVTIPEPLPVGATFDMMMRPAGPVTFSNFDMLSHTLPLPAGFPEDAVIRSDDPSRAISSGVIQPFLHRVYDRYFKELLITPRGLRLVRLLAEADRARYGVLRQAEFGDVRLGPTVLRDMIVALLALRSDIENRNSRMS
jgi:hypothetical protein